MSPDDLRIFLEANKDNPGTRIGAVLGKSEVPGEWDSLFIGGTGADGQYRHAQMALPEQMKSALKAMFYNLGKSEKYDNDPANLSGDALSV